jgi:hypothetical protein
MAGSTGVLIPPKGYLQRLREITKKHGILLIFDEVITAVRARGARASPADLFGVVPDMITFAKGVTSGAGAHGRRAGRERDPQGVHVGPPGAIELFHGYTYSAHPLACAAGVATLKLYEDEELFARAAAMAPKFEDALHSLRGVRNVVDIRNIGLVGGSRARAACRQPGRPRLRDRISSASSAACWCATPATSSRSPRAHRRGAQIDQIVSTLREVLQEDRMSGNGRWRWSRARARASARRARSRCCSDGWSVVLTARRAENCEAAIASPAAARRALAVKSDVGDPESVKALFAGRRRSSAASTCSSTTPAWARPRCRWTSCRSRSGTRRGART